MRFARVETRDGVVEGTYHGDTVEVDGQTYEIGTEGTLLAPCEPGALYTMGFNYSGYVDMHLESEEPPKPFGFSLKAPNGIRASGEPVEYPSFTSELGYGGELTAVIGERAKDVDVADVPDVVRGYTIMNDLLAMDQDDIGTMKVFDGSAPLGPAIATDVDPTNLDMRTTIDGEVRQEANTGEMLQTPAEIVSGLSQRCTLQPGDVIALGSPANPGTVEPGDVIEIWYEGIGTLENEIVGPMA
ncbi:MAG: fumarylacetoacetate hydrolase family protein [Halodesulfurarchaeum sp.]